MKASSYHFRTGFSAKNFAGRRVSSHFFLLFLLFFTFLLFFWIQSTQRGCVLVWYTKQLATDRPSHTCQYVSHGTQRNRCAVYVHNCKVFIRHLNGNSHYLRPELSAFGYNPGILSNYEHDLLFVVDSRFLPCRCNTCLQLGESTV
jgi:hypothetical protein